MAIERLLAVEDYDDYVDHLLPDDRAPELINGRYVMAARPTIQHGHYQVELIGTLRTYIRDHHLMGRLLPEVEVVLDEHTVLIPDLLFVSFTNEESQARIENDRIYGAPDFVCEILSPSTRQRDLGEKYIAYLKAGVREYWVVDPNAPAGKRFTLYERVTQGTTSTFPAFRRIDGLPDASRIFPGVVIDEQLL